ncbi:hypothetical protein WHZ77_15080 [Bradyrhizobium sp. A5]|uniref:hypothetical protein n=1 Tax=Bradyrhizobium sp. A5 TaxID=3133696 RepID=UPI0032515C56
MHAGAKALFQRDHRYPRFGKNAGAPKSLSGDGVKAAFDNAALAKFAPVVTEIGVNFPDK